jgi:hypothetical protein
MNASGRVLYDLFICFICETLVNEVLPYMGNMDLKGYICYEKDL